MNKELFNKLKRDKKRIEEFKEKYKEMEHKYLLQRQALMNDYAKQMEERMFFQYGNEVSK